MMRSESRPGSEGLESGGGERSPEGVSLVPDLVQQEAFLPLRFDARGRRA